MFCRTLLFWIFWRQLSSVWVFWHVSQNLAASGKRRLHKIVWSSERNALRHPRVSTYWRTRLFYRCCPRLLLARFLPFSAKNGVISWWMLSDTKNKERDCQDSLIFHDSEKHQQQCHCESWYGRHRDCLRGTLALARSGRFIWQQRLRGFRKQQQRYYFSREMGNDCLIDNIQPVGCWIADSWFEEMGMTVWNLYSLSKKNLYSCSVKNAPASNV